ncbi:erythromycin esterase family protein [Pendulispora albinea]|uniref:Erythromycin esterase family protein n=2 Tax=Pendulispora albinea TaxID=2741071 RepID=A0ABZ2M9Y2_9BACT
MAYILEKQRELDFPHVKTVVWAHNGHLVYTPYGSGGFEPEGTIPMGAQIRERLGREYEAIAFTAYDTKINWPGIEEPMPTPSAGSIEDKLHQLGENHLLVDLKHISRRFIEPGKEYEISWVNDVPTKAYGAILYLGYSPPMDALFW